MKAADASDGRDSSLRLSIAVVVVVLAILGTAPFITRRSADPRMCETPAGALAASVVSVDESLALTASLLHAVENATAVVADPVQVGTLIVAFKDGDVDAVTGALRRSLVTLAGDVSTGTEQGLLGLEISPSGDRIFLNFTDRTGATNVVEYRMNDGQVVSGSQRPLLIVDQPGANHNGGHVAFGPDGYLYVGFGDGGAGYYDRDSWGLGANAQDKTTVFGSIIRFDPDSTVTIPVDGVIGPGVEVVARGLRNPWRFGWDPLTNDLWIGDVGQYCWEEIDLLPESEPVTNFGWDGFEGTHRFLGVAPETSTPPVFEYGHTDGRCSVVGGSVYRGSDVAHLVGGYLFGDTCSGEIFVLMPDSDGYRFMETTAYVPALVGFFTWPDGEMGAVSIREGIFQLTG